MATATYYAYANGGSEKAYQGKVTLTETVNVASNSSTIDYKFWLYRADGYTGAGHNFSNGNKLTVSMNGTTLINSANYKAVNLTGTSEAWPFLMCSGSLTVPHNSDGTKSFSFSFAYDETQNVGQTLDYLTVSGTHTCTRIARASAVSAPASCNFGSAATITITAASSSFTHNLRYAFCGTSGTIKNGAGSSTSWTLSSSLMSLIPTVTKTWITIYCDTYSGSTLIGTTSCTMDTVVPSNIVPSISSVAASEAGWIPTGITGYVQGRSKLKITTTAAGAYGSTIKSCSVTVDGVTYSGTAITTNIVTKSGTLSITVTVTDSRGRTAAKTISVSVAAYTQPVLTSITAYRCKGAADASADPSGAYICVRPRGSVTALNDKNAKGCIVYYKKQSASSYSSVTVPMSDYVLDTEQVIFAADVASSYDIYARLGDGFSYTLATAVPVMSAGTKLHMPKNKNRIGIGKRAEVDGVDIGWPVYLRKDATIYSGSTAYSLADAAARVNSFPVTSYESSGLDVNEFRSGFGWFDWSKCSNAPWDNGYGFILAFSLPSGATGLQIAVRWLDGAFANRIRTSSSGWDRWFFRK